MNKYHYLYNVAYFHSLGNGCSQIYMKSKINSLAEFNGLREYIEKTNNLKNVVIINYQLISKKVNRLILEENYNAET